MSSCAGCGADNPPAARYCSSCGAPLAEAGDPGAVRKTVTVLFCDLAGSTQMGERLDAETLREILARYFRAIRQVIEFHGGTVEKFIGDAVMAVFGVPLVHEDDALRALRAASAILETLAGLNEQLGEELGTKLGVRIGVDTGEVVTGTEERLAAGDVLNVAARLEQAAEPGQVLLGEETLQLAHHAIEVEPLAPLALKGKSHPVAAYRLLAVRPEVSAEPRSETPMVDRRIELRHLRDAFDEAVRQRSCRLFTVVGSAGVGKSRLSRELLASIGESAVLSGRCLSYGEGITYWPVVEALRPLQAQMPDLRLDPVAAGTMDKLLNGAPSSTDEIAWAFRKLVEALAQRTPVVLLFDDIQWAEDAFIDLVEHLGTLSREAPILVLCLARPELLDQRSNWIADVRLQPLPPSDAEELIARCMGGLEITGGTREKILDASGGNPLFVEQMSAVAQTSGGDDLAVPPSLRALLAARLDQLDPAERRVLERASIEGEVFHRGALQALLPEETNLTRRLTGLVRKELISPNAAQLPGEDAFRFRHLLIRDAAYEGTPKAGRAELHERFADWLEAKMHPLAGELQAVAGYHLEQAYGYRVALGTVEQRSRELAARASDLLASAGDASLARGDAAAALNLMERAISMLPTGAPERARLLPRFGHMFRVQGNYPRAMTVLDEAIGAATLTADTAVILRSRIERALVTSLSDPRWRSDEVIREAEEAIPTLAELGDEIGLATAWEAIAIAHWMLLRCGATMEALKNAVEHARRIGAEAQVIENQTWICAASIQGPDTASQMAALGRSLLDEGRQSLRLEVWRSLLVASAQAMQGRFGEARALISHTREIADELGLFEYSAGVAARSCTIETRADNPAAAEREARKAFELAERAGATNYSSTGAAELALVLCALARYDEAEHFVEVSRSRASPEDIATHEGWRRALAKVMAARDEHGQAIALAAEAVALLEPTDDLNHLGDALTDLGELLAGAGQRDAAVDALRRALAVYERKENAVAAAKVRVRLSELSQAS
jgi:class 3 adenylate cyclase/tetratricopeptide (TPR) repeat protein